MPVEFAPPAGPAFNPMALQGPQYTDPLQTLAGMQEMRTRAIQSQQAQLGLQQAQMQMESNRAMLDAMANGGGDWQKTRDLMANSGKVLPGDLIAMDQHRMQYMTQAATLKKDQQEALQKDINQYAGLLDGVTDQATLDNANLRAEQMGIGTNVQRLTQYPGDPQHVKAFANSLLGQSQILENTLKGQQIEEAKAGTQEKLVGTQQKQQEVASGQLAAAVRDIQMAPVDPATGTPTPQAWAELRTKYPSLNLPDTPNAQFLSQIQTAAVPVKDQPQFELAKLKARLGMFGDDPEQQFIARFALANGHRSVAELTLPEYRQALQQYAEAKQDPQMRAIALAQKNLSEQMLQAQVGALPTKEGIDQFANMMLNHDMAPSQFNDLRSGRVSWAPQVFQRAAQIAAANGQTFSPANLDADYKAMERTEQAFTTGKEAQMARSFSNLMEHISLLDDARKALNGSNLPLLQQIGNYVGAKFGGTAKTQYDEIAQYVAGEAAKAFVPGGGGEAERANSAAHFESKLGNDQIQKNIHALMELADAQKRGLEFQYKQGTYGKGTQPLFTPQAIDSRNRFLPPEQQQQPAPAPQFTPQPGGTPRWTINGQREPTVMPKTGVTVQLKSGSVATFPDQKTADKFRQDHPDRVQ